MDIVNATQVTSSSLLGDILRGLTSLPGVSDIILIVKAIGILVALYVIFLIIRGISQISMASRLKTIATNVEQMNAKMDLLVGKKNIRREKK